jgi:hypothetical protein
MKNRGPCVVMFMAVLSCIAGLCYASAAQKQSARHAKQNGATMTFRAKGTFEPTLTPQPPEDKAEGSTLGRMSISKKWHGGLEATSEGQMLTAVTDMKGSAGYVAIERVTGTLNGRRGSFVMQHMGILNRGAAHLTVTAVPDSGTGELAGIAISNFELKIDPNGKHFYEFDYTLPGKP